MRHKNFSLYHQMEQRFSHTCHFQRWNKCTELYSWWDTVDVYIARSTRFSLTFKAIERHFANFYLKEKKQTKLATRFANRNISCVIRQVDRTLTQITNICSILQSKIAIANLRNQWANACVSSCHSFRFNIANYHNSCLKWLKDTHN